MVIMLYYISALYLGAPQRWIAAICGGSGRGRHPALLHCQVNLGHCHGCLPPSASCLCHVEMWYSLLHRRLFLCARGAAIIKAGQNKKGNLTTCFYELSPLRRSLNTWLFPSGLSKPQPPLVKHVCSDASSTPPSLQHLFIESTSRLWIYIFFPSPPTLDSVWPAVTAR